MTRVVVLVALLAVGVGIAVRYVNGLFADKQRDLARAESGDLARPDVAPSKPPASPPLRRSFRREDEVLVVEEASTFAPRSATDTRPAARRRVLTLAGDGLLTRRPFRADEPGPLVTALVDRADVDALLRAARAAPAVEGGATHVVRTVFDGRVDERAVAAAPPAVLGAVGRSLDRSAWPAQAFLRLAQVEGDDAAATAIPWPLGRRAPAPFLAGAPVELERGRAREWVAAMKPGAVWTHADGLFRVDAFDPLPPP
ncbi:MAG TPA: hypothetical protein VEI02_16250 [Planctomycetota bacterium]|nr:hypothetical protein [Planctomycetota bacterium]